MVRRAGPAGHTPKKRTAVPVTGGGAVTPFPGLALTGISREVVNDAGGMLVTVYGNGFAGTNTVAVGGTAGTYVSHTGGSLTFLTPAKAIGGPYDVVVSQGASSATLAARLEVVAAPVTVFAQTDEANGSLGAWTPQAWPAGSSVGIVTHPTAGDKAVACVAVYDGNPSNTNVAGAQLQMAHPNNPAAASVRGKWTGWRLELTAAALAAVVNDTVAGGQIKLYLYRDQDLTPSSARNSIVVVIGAQARGLQIAVFLDDGNVPLSGTGTDNVAFTDGDTHFYPAAAQEFDLLLWEYNDGSVGHVKFFLNGKRLINATTPNGGADSQLGSASAADPYETRLGIAYTERVDGSSTLYVRDAWVADGLRGDPVYDPYGGAEPTFRVGVDTNLIYDDWQAETPVNPVPTATFGAQSWHKLDSGTESPNPTVGHLEIVGTGGPTGFPKFIRCHYDDMAAARAADPTGYWACGNPSPSDSWVGLEKYSAWPYFAGTVVPGQWWAAIWYRRWAPGYRFTHYTDADTGGHTLIANGCGRGNAQKEFIAFRNQNNALGRLTLTASYQSKLGARGPIYSPTLWNPSNYDDVMTWWWSVGINRIDGVSKGSYPQHMNNAYNGVDKSPLALRDGNWHRFAALFRTDTYEDAGNGALKMFVDGLPTHDYDGLVPGKGLGVGVFIQYSASDPNPDNWTGIAGHEAVGINNAGAAQAQNTDVGPFRLFLPASV